MKRQAEPPARRAASLLADELDDVVHRRAGLEDAGHADLLQAFDILIGMMPPTSTSTSSILFCLSKSITRGTMALCRPKGSKGR